MCAYMIVYVVVCIFVCVCIYYIFIILIFTYHYMLRIIYVNGVWLTFFIILVSKE